jgi:hypothetical protein
VKISEMFGNDFVQRKVVWSKRGDHIERHEVDRLQTSHHFNGTQLELEDKETNSVSKEDK